MVTKSILIASTLVFISSCSEKGCEDLVLDTIKFHDTITTDERTYYLYSRTTGWQEKVVFFELYEKEPTFNKCTDSTIKPIFARAFDDTEEQPYIKNITLQPKRLEKLKITYTKNKEEGVANIYDVKFTR